MESIEPINVLAHAAWNYQVMLGKLAEEADKINRLKQQHFKMMNELIRRLEAGTLTREQISNTPQGCELMDAIPSIARTTNGTKKLTKKELNALKDLEALSVSDPS
jgi:hypothetical protein